MAAVPTLTEVGDRTDAALVDAARGGDETAVRELLERHLPSVLAVCRKRLRSLEELDDALQTTAERALRRLDQLREPERAGAWIRAIAANVCIDMNRDAAREPVTVPETEIPREVHLHESVDLDGLVVARERARHVHRHLETLDERDRLALWWRDALDVSVQQIADTFGLTNGSARVMLTRARNRFREAYQGPAVVLAGWRLAVRETFQRFARQPVFGAGDALAQVAAAVAAVALMTLSGAASSGTDEAPVPDVARIQFSAAESAVPIETAAPKATTEVAAADAPAPAARPDGHASVEDPGPTGDVDARVGPVVVTQDEPEEEPVIEVKAIAEGEELTGTDVYAGEVNDVIEGVVTSGAASVGDIARRGT